MGIDFAFAHATVPLSFQSVDNGVPSPITEFDHSTPVRRDKNKSHFYKEGTKSFYVLVQLVT